MAFNPEQHLMSLPGTAKRGPQEYLEVKWRIAWLRDAHPDAILTTESIKIDANFAMFKAHVEIPGGGIGEGHGSETGGDFKDFIEKAETKAIGRALAALGYGTQFAVDFADADDGRIADAPVDRQAIRQPAQRPQPVPQQVAKAQPSPEEQQLRSRVQELRKQLGISPEAFEETVKKLTGGVTFAQCITPDLEGIIKRMEAKLKPVDESALNARREKWATLRAQAQKLGIEPGLFAPQAPVAEQEKTLEALAQRIAEKEMGIAA